MTQKKKKQCLPLLFLIAIASRSRTMHFIVSVFYQFQEPIFHATYLAENHNPQFQLFKK